MLQDLEAEYYAARNAQQQQPTAPMQGQMQTSDVSALLKLINSQPQAQQSHQPQPATQAPTNELEAIFAHYSQQQQQTPQAPMQPATQQPPAYNFQAALAAMHMPNQVQPAYASVPQNQQPNLQSILAQLNQQPQAPIHNYGYSNPYQGSNDRKRQADHDDQSNGNFGFGQGKRQKGPEKKVQRVQTLSIRIHKLTGTNSSTSVFLHCRADSGKRGNAEKEASAPTSTSRSGLLTGRILFVLAFEFTLAIRFSDYPQA